MGRILALDYGDIHIGVALSDETGQISMPFKTIIKKDKFTIKPAVKEIGEIIKEYDIKTIVVGYPKNMDDTLGIRAEVSEDFKNRLERNFKKIDILLWDERLTTQAAKELLDEMQVSPKERKQMIDQVAASIILRDYIEATSREQK